MFRKELNSLKKQHLLRQLSHRSSCQGPFITINRKRYLNFSSNDYLGLAGHPEIAAAAVEAAEKYGIGSGASRLLAGGSVLHERLEKDVARFKSSESALVFNSGYAANTGIIPAIAAEGDVIFSDALNHASIVDGCRLSRAKTLIFRHREISHLEDLLKREKKAGRRIVITDSVFSMDGDISPLNELAALCRRFNSLLYIDDAHGTGVLGDGRGALAHFTVRPEPWIIQMGTFSKAFGSFGAFAAGSRDVIEWLINQSRSFIYSTALPSPVIAASIKAIQIVRKEKNLVRRLWANRALLAKGLEQLGFDIMGSETPIIPVRTGSIKEAIGLSGHLFGKGIYAPAIRPPSVSGPRIRITVSSAHTEEHIGELLKTLKNA